MTYFIIEHNSLGILKKFDSKVINGVQIKYPRFTWRGYKHKGWIVASFDKAKAALDLCIKSGRREMQGCCIRRITM